MISQENIPKLRFPEFNGQWKTVKIGSILKERKERSGDGGMLSVTINHGIVKFDEIDRKDNSSKDKSNYKKVYKNDIAYNSMRMWQGASGKSEFDGIVSPAYTVTTPIESINSSFIAYYFKTYNMIHKFKIYSQGLTSDTWNLKYNQLKDIKINICSKEEQDKISNLLMVIDKHIEKQNQKLNFLEQQKRGYMQKIFSQGLRFKDEEGNYYKEWDTKQLKDVLEFSNKRTTNENEYPVLTSSRQGLILQSDYYKDGKTFAESNIGYFILPKNYITYRSRSDDGIFKFNLNQIIDVGIISKYYPVFKGINTNQYYLTLHLNYQLKKEYIKYATGTSQLVLSQKNLQNIQTKLPSYEEQTKIAKFLSELDKLIEKQSDKVELLKDRKKGLLQKMFV